MEQALTRRHHNHEGRMQTRTLLVQAEAAGLVSERQGILCCVGTTETTLSEVGGHIFKPFGCINASYGFLGPLAVELMQYREHRFRKACVLLTPRRGVLTEWLNKQCKTNIR